MSTLKDQLAKLGMISESKESSYDNPRHNDRRDRRRDSRSNRGQYSYSSRDRYDRSERFNRSDRSRSDRSDRSQNRRQRPTDPEVLAKEINQLFDKARLPMPPSGVKRIYFELESGEVDFLEVDHASYQAMNMGHINLVLDPRGRPCFLNRRAMSELRFLDPNWGKKNQDELNA